MTDLKPCPFCGGKARVRVSDSISVMRIECTECHVATTTFIADSIGESEAVEAWNTRHVETCTIGDYKDSDYGYTHTAMWNDEWFMPSGTCSGCGEYIPVMNYCPSCGRKVEG